MMGYENQKGMFAPKYYREFQCIADKCRHSCCIDWEICIDEETYEKYQRLEDVIGTVVECEDGPCFALTERGRCPHLNEKGLCKIILSHGEAYLSEICRNHPRFFNDLGDGRMEAGLGLVCEEACRLILTDETDFGLTKIEDLEDLGEDEDASRDFDALPTRARIVSILEANDQSFEDAVAMLRDMFGIPELHTPKEWLERFSALEILEEDWRGLLQTAKARSARSDSTAEFGKYYQRLLRYFIYRHVSVAESEDDLRARLGFAILSAETIRYLFETGEELSLEALIDMARRYSAEIEYSEDNTFELMFEFERSF